LEISQQCSSTFLLFSTNQNGPLYYKESRFIKPSTQ